MVNSPKPEATAAAPVPAKASAITSNDQPRALLQQQQAAAGSSSRQPPPSASVSMSLHPDVSTVSYGNPNYPSPQHQALSPGKQQSHHQPQQQQQQQQQKQKQKQRQPLIYSPDYDEIVRENETLHQQLIVLTRENEKMERRCNIFADRIDNLERQIKKFAFLQQSFEKDGLDHGGGAADSFSENSISGSGRGRVRGEEFRG
ncbi:hypothetical protein BX666DRAFT_1882036 [Dichotomocladium elegans]|nr:hypothetical protein BX666DRAFT_1882036 [Dichotomocladium elegans]